jgi:hypothetical protein
MHWPLHGFLLPHAEPPQPASFCGASICAATAEAKARFAPIMKVPSMRTIRRVNLLLFFIVLSPEW